MTLFQHPRASWLDPATGNLRDQADLMRAMAAHQVVLLGETHDVAEIHRWQLHVTAYLHGLKPHLAVGYEMFPRRLQPELDLWVAGAYSTAAFLEAVRWHEVWGFDPELYLPLFHFCRQQRVRMLALNCHRPLVTRVGKEGWAAIPEDERDGLTPAAAATPAYRDYLFAITGGGGPARTATNAQDPAFDRFVRAQQTWDRAFACNIARVLDAPDPPLVVGIIGRGHLEFGHGTPFQLRDLGVRQVAVLLPTDKDQHEAGAVAGIAEAIFRLDQPEPPSTFRARRDRPG
ncbi:MAG: ChaN family lipoprotein [Rhizobiales bacterium]|nr:ChaN family lipoprotein [Hyphomicrobiales bacterium]